MKYIPDIKVIHVRFIKPMEDEYASTSSRQQCISKPVTPT